MNRLSHVLHKLEVEALLLTYSTTPQIAFFCKSKAFVLQTCRVDSVQNDTAQSVECARVNQRYTGRSRHSKGDFVQQLPGCGTEFSASAELGFELGIYLVETTHCSKLLSSNVTDLYCTASK